MSIEEDIPVVPSRYQDRKSAHQYIMFAVICGVAGIFAIAFYGALPDPLRGLVAVLPAGIVLGVIGMRLGARVERLEMYVPSYTGGVRELVKTEKGLDISDDQAGELLTGSKVVTHGVILQLLEGSSFAAPVLVGTAVKN